MKWFRAIVIRSSLVALQQDKGAMSDTAVVIVAAGKGERAGGGVPKQYRQIAGRPLLAWTLAPFLEHGRVGPIQLVIDPGQGELYAAATHGMALLEPVPGGVDRQASVLAGLEALEAHGPDKVMIHDAARPFVTASLIDRLLACLDEGAVAAIPALPITDTVKRCRDGIILDTLDRNELTRAQTPQTFRYRDILAAHRAAVGASLTDDAAVAEAAGLRVAAVDGEEDNIKITSAGDIAAAEARLGRRETRVGSGLDVHAFCPGDHVMLCGIAIPHDAGLAGESDADVGLHVLVDAMLGAMGEGDLGRHFPPGDPAWKGRASCDLVAVAVALMGARGIRLVHADLTIICERPRLARHQGAMQANVARLLGVTPGRVNVKVTSTDGLGFAGRGEGIAGMASVTLEVPCV